MLGCLSLDTTELAVKPGIIVLSNLAMSSKDRVSGTICLNRRFKDYVLRRTKSDDTWLFIDTSVESLGFRKFQSSISRILTGTVTLGRLIKYLNKGATVYIATSISGFYGLAAVVGVLCWFSRSNLVIRLYGGSTFRDGTNGRPAIERVVFSLIIRLAGKLFLETRRQLLHLLGCASAPKIIQVPNSRYEMLSQKAESEKDALVKKTFTFVFAGRGVETKGIRELIEAYCDSSLAGTILEIYTDDHERFMKHIDLLDSQVREGIRLLPPYKYDECISVLSRASVLVLPTYYETEGHPGIILEATICGIPVISTDYAAIPEVIDSTAGILVQPGSVSELRSAMVRVYQDKMLYRELANGSRRLARTLNIDTDAIVMSEILATHQESAHA